MKPKKTNTQAQTPKVIELFNADHREAEKAATLAHYYKCRSKYPLQQSVEVIEAW